MKETFITQYSTIATVMTLYRKIILSYWLMGCALSSSVYYSISYIHMYLSFEMQKLININ